mmetsp:Transcript_81099/g.250299  ORF Transcript_81099/g.250299 Transcript_81099/m.250299 type:complete len:89 (+) Transcript_81099:77-343(+)
MAPSEQRRQAAETMVTATTAAATASPGVQLQGPESCGGRCEGAQERRTQHQGGAVASTASAAARIDEPRCGGEVEGRGLPLDVAREDM